MTKRNALADCRAAVNRQIEFLEHEIGIEEAFPVTICLLRLSQDLTVRIQAEERKAPVCSPNLQP